MIRITMKDYSEESYIEIDEITQGCIIPLIDEFKIKKSKGTLDEEPFGILIIENACDLFSEEACDLLKIKARLPKVKKLKYIVVYSASELIDNLSKKKFADVQNLLQNRRFHENPIIFLPPNDYYNSSSQKFPDGFYGLCNKIGAIELKILETYKLKKHLCITSPLKEYIQNKIIYFNIKEELRVPLKTVSDLDMLEWLIIRKLSMEGELDYLELFKMLRPNIIEEPNFKTLLTNMVQESKLEIRDDRFFKLYQNVSET